ncbi:DUF2516 family protein [Williamsia phyllosphaerae]|uniref:DUF2516 domain-containing protein n=1 Tax=Williamsia phyllosphaerae TaxID=885042 RepID=A0ABQ1U4P4_9NOCA|nr:DUF2516 family protein [Williamsia phyllosphaerae]GGF09162.1 hypothetical protein GCM10007298_01350 [Williamsia phyllosphaerae]
MNFVSVLDYSRSFFVLILTVIAGVAALVALIHAAIQRPDAFPAVDRQSKVIWVSILVVATLFLWLFGLLGIFGIIGIVAVLVYLVDVRPRVDSIQNKKWFRKV